MDNLLKKAISTILTSIGYSKKEKEKTVSLMEIQIKNKEQERLQKVRELRSKTPKERWKIIWNFIRKWKRDKLKGYDTEQPFEQILPFSEEEKKQWRELRNLAIWCIDKREKNPPYYTKVEEFRWRKAVLSAQKRWEAEKELKRLDKENKEVKRGRKRKNRRRRKKVLINVTIST